MNVVGTRSRVAGLALAFAAVASVGAQVPSHDVPSLVADLNREPRTGAGPERFTTVGAQTFFVAATPTTGRELWRTDGSVEGTRLVKEVVPGVLGSGFYDAAAVGDLLFFVATQDGRFWTWRSDGTAAGTWGVGPGAFDAWITDVGGVAYYAAEDELPRTLWRSDGTPEGTARIREPGLAGGPIDPRWLCALGERVFFSGWNADHGDELWVSDGTAEGTRRVADLDPGPSSSGPSQLVRLGEHVLFVADAEADDGDALWRVDASETLAVVADGAGRRVRNLFAADELAFFSDRGEVWRTDGTPAGTLRLLGADAGTMHEGPFVAAGAFVYFVFDGVGTGGELWRTDGTPEGTTLVADLTPGPTGSGISNLIADGDGVAFLVAPDFVTRSVVRSDGTAQGTQVLVTFPRPSAEGTAIALAGSGILFAAGDGAGGRQLWRTERAPGTASLLRDLSPGTADSAPGPFLLSEGRVFFGATEQTSRELWRSDGSEAGTVRLPGLAAPYDWFDPFAIRRPAREGARLGGEQFYLGASGGLWKLPAGRETPVLVHPIVAGTPDPSRLLVWHEAIWFLLRTAAGSHELWRSDGSELGTGMVTSLPLADPFHFGTPELLDAGERLLLIADGEVWSSDGTALPPELMLPRDDGQAGARHLASLGEGRALFVAWEGTGWAVWASDGTAPGTQRVRLLEPSSEPPDPLESLGDRVLFAHRDAVGGAALWTSDGTEEGTEPLMALVPAGFEGPVASLFRSGSILYVAADDGLHGRELWKTDGTPEGTALVRDIVPGPSGSHVRELAAWGERLVFTACDDAAGCEPWTSDGTEAGTQRLADLVPGPLGSDPGDFASDGVRLVFAASSEAAGREVWWVPEPGAGAAGLAALAALAWLLRGARRR